MVGWESSNRTDRIFLMYATDGDRKYLSSHLLTNALQLYYSIIVIAYSCRCLQPFVKTLL